MADETKREYAEMLFKSQFKLYDEADRKKVGLAPTPMAEVFRQGPLTLYRRRGGEASPHAPVVVVPSLINRPYIMDLIAGHSLFEALGAADLDLFLVDWGVPDESIGHFGFSDYTSKLLRRAIRQVKRIRGVEKVQLVGQCIGGIIAALYAAHPELSQDLERLVLLTTPLDFKDSGLLSSWTDPETFDLDRITCAFRGIVPADFLHQSFPLLDIKRHLGRYETLLKNMEIPDFKRIWQALDIWANDNVPFALEAFRDLIRLCYQENRLVTGKFLVDGRPVGIRDIAVPTLAIAAKEDHVFTEPAAHAIHLSQAAKTKRLRYHVMPAGHVTLIAAHPVRHETYKLFTDFLTVN